MLRGGTVDEQTRLTAFKEFLTYSERASTTLYHQKESSTTRFEPPVSFEKIVS